MALAVMGLLLGLLLLDNLIVVTYGKAENGGLDATADTDKRLGRGGWIECLLRKAYFLMSR